MSVPFLHTDNGGTAPQRAGLKHPSIAPYGAFEDACGMLTLISIQNEREWQRLCTQVLGSTALFDDARFQTNELRVTHRADLETAISLITATLKTEELRGLLQAASIAYGALNSVEDLLTHTALLRRQVCNSQGSTVSMPAHPVTHSTPNTAIVEAPRCVPTIDEHGDALRGEFG